MNLSSPEIAFDKRLLTIEEQFRQRKYAQGVRDLKELGQQGFAAVGHDHGLHLLLQADGGYFEGNYKASIEAGLEAARLFAASPFNRRYGRVQLVLSKSYSAIGDLKNAEIRARDALSAFRRCSDAVGQVDPLNELARISFIRCDYASSVEFLEEALGRITNDPRRIAQFSGNVGRIRIQTGQWGQAEKDIRLALDYAEQNGQEMSQVINLLSLGYLQMKQRRFILSSRSLDRALEIISRLDLKREKIIYLEYAGELAYEKGDFFRAKAILGDAYQQGVMLAPDSALVTQSGRRLAEAELAMDNVAEAMKYGQKALELSLALGERAEIGMAHRVIATVFAARGEFGDAISHARQALELLRPVGDPLEIARTLLALAGIKVEADSSKHEAIRAAFEEASRIFKKLKLDYWLAETDYRAAVFACRRGDLSTGFKRLNRAEKIFSTLGEKARLRAAHKFLSSLSDQAVALSISQGNEYKIFGNLITPVEYTSIKSSRLEDVLGVLTSRTGSDRAIVFVPDSKSKRIIASSQIAEEQRTAFADVFCRLLGQEFSKTRPTLLLDCRRDPFVGELLPGVASTVSSVIVVPFTTSDGMACYLYLDRLCHNGGLKPYIQQELNFAVGFSDLIAFKWAEMQRIRLEEDNLRLKKQLMEKSAFPNIVTANREMLRLLDQVRQVLNASISISIEGETGCGKDLLAQAIHYNSNRRAKRFISVNCAALPETLLESELFGYKRGAFTGADKDKTGLFEEADGGTFFLDEIADMPLTIQAKILRVLESKEIVRLGETTPRTVDVRILSATNKVLKDEMSDGRFRQDLYYRLTALSFTLPPLRSRREDIPLLVSRFLEDSDKRVAPETMKRLVAYDWPGNIRELQNEVMKIVLLAGDEEVIEPEVLSARVSGDGNGDAVRGNGELSDNMVFDREHGLYDYLAAHERRFIVRALKEKDGVKKHAAAILNIPESTLRLKIKQYSIDLKNLGSY
ncbi:MAG: sigma 54-interacting transcriptional regulator [Candidatus Zixiibacteriota bacterium]